MKLKIDDLTIPACPGIRTECLQDGNLTRRYGSVITSYDPERKIGGLFYLGTSEWLSFFPIEPDDFAARAARSAALVHQQETEQVQPSDIN